MPGESCDIVVFGTSPFALLLAGLLHSQHGKRVSVVGDAWSAYRLPRGFDVSVMPVSRPETWELLRRSTAETLKLLRAIGRGLYERVDPLFVAETEAASDGLGHMRWVAEGLGFAVEPVAGRAAVSGDATIYRLRDAVKLTGSVEPVLEGWLERLGVRRLPARDTTLSFSRSGHAIIGHGDNHIESETAVLADDTALIARLAEPDRPRLLRTEWRTSVVTEPARRRVTAPLIVFLDRGLALQQAGPGGPVTAVAAGQADLALPRIASSLARQGRLRRTGQTSFQAVETVDGAPLVSRLGKGKALIIAGLGASAAFLAPVLSRIVADAASPAEASYFSVRGASGSRQSAADMATTEFSA
jgi:hypothetical protein